MSVTEIICVLGVILVINLLLFIVLFLCPVNIEQDKPLVCEEIACGDLLSVFYQLCYKACPRNMPYEDYILMMLNNYGLGDRKLSKDEFIEKLQDAISDLKTKISTKNGNSI